MLGSQLGRIINRTAISFPLSGLRVRLSPSVHHGHPYFLHDESRNPLLRTPLRAVTTKSRVAFLGICTSLLLSTRASYLNLCPPCFTQVFITRAFILCELCLRAVSFEMRVHAAYVRVLVHSWYLSIMQLHDAFKTRLIFLPKTSLY